MKKACPVTFEDVASLENLCAVWEEFIRGKRKEEATLQSYLGMLSHGDAQRLSMTVQNLFWLYGAGN